jgi:hypothetical protein
MLFAQNAKVVAGSVAPAACHTPNANSLNSDAVRQKRERMMNPLNRTKTIGIKVSESAFETLRRVTETQKKPLGERWRDTLMKAAMPRRPRASGYGRRNHRHAGHSD